MSLWLCLPTMPWVKSLQRIGECFVFFYLSTMHDGRKHLISRCASWVFEDSGFALIYLVSEVGEDNTSGEQVKIIWKTNPFQSNWRNCFKELDLYKMLGITNKEPWGEFARWYVCVYQVNCTINHARHHLSVPKPSVDDSTLQHIALEHITKTTWWYSKHKYTKHRGTQFRKVQNRLINNAVNAALQKKKAL